MFTCPSLKISTYCTPFDALLHGVGLVWLGVFHKDATAHFSLQLHDSMLLFHCIAALNA